MQSSQPFSIPGKRIVSTGGYKVELDLASQVLAIKAPHDIEEGVKSGSAEAPLRSTLGASTGLVSAAVLAQKAKIFDDGLYAAVEVAAQQGAGRHGGKAGLLASLGGALAQADPAESGGAQELILAAARLGQVTIPDAPPAAEARAQRACEEFLSDELRSKPIGFYTWSRQLSSIFQQDRILQVKIDAAAIKALTSALRADPLARATYEGHLRLLSRLSNPFAEPDLRSFLEAADQGSVAAGAQETCFLPPSVAHETEIVKKLFSNRPIPSGFVLVDEMIQRIRSGELDLEPRPDSGWYDYQTWALKPLVIPERMHEGKRLEFDEEYRKLLLELFKGLLTLTRETHIKQLEIPMDGAAMPDREVYIDIAPALSAEPLATHYLRRALGYRYVRQVLEDAFGPGQIERLHRLTQSGPVPTCLAEDLAEIEALFMGAHETVSRELGLTPYTASASDASPSQAAGQFAAWAGKLQSDSDLSQDLRCMVPVFYDLERGKTKVWLFLGWTSRPITVSFAQPPLATILDRNGKPPRHHPRIRWGALGAYLPYPVTAEVYVDKILDRDEFRSLCDDCRTRSQILGRLAVAG